jgi:lysophospholipase L1-like esterase
MVYYKTGPKLILMVLGLFGLLAFTAQNDHFTVFLAGDSTMAVKQVKAYPETGWGMPFADYFDKDVTIDNRARNGRSTKTFISEGLWSALINDVKPNDYVFIQFGHNDEVPTKASYTPEADFRNNLIKFVTDTRNKQAYPVLLTPVTRRYFDTTGHIKETHLVYSKIVREVAAEYKVPLIDLDEISRAFFDKYGPENSKFFFNQLAPGENPNYPAGRKDNTHFNELGARSVAELVLQAIKDLKLPLANNIVKQAK